MENHLATEAKVLEQMKFERIVVAVHGSDNAARAAKVATTLAEKFNAELIVCHAIQSPFYSFTQDGLAVPPDVLKQILASVPIGRLCKPEEIARAVVFLASEDAGSITGATLSINGGKYMP